MEKRIPDLYLEQQLLGELSPEKELEITRSPGYTKKVRELEDSNREILENYPADRMVSLIQKRMGEAEIHELTERKSSSRSRVYRAVPLLAAAVLAISVILPLTMNRAVTEAPSTDESGIRIKGLETNLKVYRKSGEEVELLPDETPVSDFDLIQLSYVSGGKKYGTIFSIDGNGFITLHYPDFTDASPELRAGGEVPLDFSYQLDDAPGFERFFFVTSDSDFPVNTVMESAEKLAGSYDRAMEGNLEIPEAFETDSILLIKEGSDE